jgi:hypothetical protein
MSDELGAFFGGMIIGIAILAFVMHITDTSPTAMQRKVYKEAVQLGYGQWLVDTNFYDGGTPRTRFGWITNSISK